jgi:hypothetical protein
MIPTLATVAIASALALSAIAVPQANAATNADWAWPGMQYDIYKNNSWYTCSVGFPAWNGAGIRYFISAGHCFRSESGTHYQNQVPTTSSPAGPESKFTVPQTNTRR